MSIHIKKRNGHLEKLDLDKINKCLERACEGLSDVSASEIALDSHVQFFDKITTAEIDKSIILCARSKIEREPNYSYVAARLLLNTIYKEVFGESVDKDGFELQYRKAFITNTRKLVKEERLDARLLEFDLKKLADALVLENDNKFKYLGIQTLYDRYFIHLNKRRMEAPQAFWMRVAMGLALNEEDKNGKAIEFYSLLSNFLYVASTPTLFNAGTRHSQLSSCYLNIFDDSIDGIFDGLWQEARKGKYAGGLGFDVTPFRGSGAYIKGTNGESQGLIPWLKLYNDTLVAVNQCFAPDTSIHTDKGAKKLEDIRKGDLVLGIDGEYRLVKEAMAYKQVGKMVEIKPKYSSKTICVTAGHPMYVVRGVPCGRNFKDVHKKLESGKLKAEWVEAGKLKKDDFAAQAIPTEIVNVPEFDCEDASFYGLMLGDGSICRNKRASIALNSTSKKEALDFVKSYLNKKNVAWREYPRGVGVQIGWKHEGFPFDRDDLYNENNKKRIHPRLAHLPTNKCLKLIKGLADADGSVTKKGRLSFTSTSGELIETLRYQILRLGIPSSATYSERNCDHIGTRSDGSKIEFKGIVKAWILRIPMASPLAEIIGVKPIHKFNWVTINGIIFSRIKSVVEIEPLPIVHDLKVEGVESYHVNSFIGHNGGKRKGAGCAYLECWHIDFEAFLDLRKPTGDERFRCHDMNTAAWVPDLFMQRVKEDGSWTLFSPNDVPELHEIYGDAFKAKYLQYEAKAEKGEIKNHIKLSAKALWKRMLTALFETSHPWLCFKDPSNLRYSNQHEGTVHSSNLCVEIQLHTKASKYLDGKKIEIGETAVCNLGSVNLPAHIENGKLIKEKVAKTVSTALRMLDNVIDINFYPTEEAANSNLKHRPVGLGVMGFHDAIHKLGIVYESDEAVEFASDCQELISYHAILGSSKLARERGQYKTYEGSLWSKGKMPIDTYKDFMHYRQKEVKPRCTLDWDKVREHVAAHGMRNSNVMAIAPTATISYIAGCSQSIEPDFSVLFVYSTLSGEFTCLNEYFVQDMKKLGLWSHELIDAVKSVNGDIALLSLPEDIKKKYKTAFQINQMKLADCAAARQKWIDMGQSFNIYTSQTSLKYLNDIYFHCWEKGLKTTYYLRSKAASGVEKSTTSEKQEKTEPKACSIEAAKRGESCESCQ